MTNRLEALEDWAAGLLGLEPASRNKLARSVGQALRRSQQQRIIAQQNVDGSKYVPRKKHNFRNKQGRMNRKTKMFQKLRTARYLKVKGDKDLICVGFTGRIARIARVHQCGLKDRAAVGSPHSRYNQREILGFNLTTLDVMRDTLLSHLKEN